MKKRFIILGLIIFFSILSGAVWYMNSLLPVSRTTAPTQIFMVRKGEGLRSISTRLSKEGLIRSSLAFFIIARLEGTAERIQEGMFHLSPSMDAKTIADYLTRGTTDIWVTIPEGWRNEEIALELAKKLSIPEKDFLANAREGYMFPDTYLFPRNASSSAIANIFLATFNSRVTPKLRLAIQEKGLTLEQVVILASLLEREAQHPQDRPVVAAILIKRLKNDWPLNVDATIQYALGYQPDEKRWWKRHLSYEDLKLDSLYNSYIHKGLPPSAICNPGLETIQAVIAAGDTEYWFYLNDSKGVMHYAKTLEEHNQNVRKYLQ